MKIELTYTEMLLLYDLVVQSHNNQQNFESADTESDLLHQTLEKKLTV